jgi:phage tail protein X
MIEARTKEERHITEIIFIHYGSMIALDQALEANRELLRRVGEWIPAGEVIKLPDVSAKESAKKRRTLWG